VLFHLTRMTCKCCLKILKAMKTANMVLRLIAFLLRSISEGDIGRY